MGNLYRGPSIDASYQVQVHLAKQFQRRIFRNPPIRNKYCLWWPCLLTNRDEMSNLNRRPSKDASYQISGSFGQAVSEEKIFQKSTNQKQGLPVVAMFINGFGRNEHSLQRNFHRCFLLSFGSFGQAVSEEEDFLEINQSKTRIACGGHVC